MSSDDAKRAAISKELTRISLTTYLKTSLRKLIAKTPEVLYAEVMSDAGSEGFVLSGGDSEWGDFRCQVVSVTPSLYAYTQESYERNPYAVELRIRQAESGSEPKFVVNGSVHIVFTISKKAGNPVRIEFEN